MSDDDFILGQEIAELLEVTSQRVSYMTRDGIIEQDGKGRYHLRTTLHRLFRYYRTRIGEGKSKAALAKQEAQALQNEILKETLKRTRGETITLAEAEKALADVILRARDKFLHLGNKLAPRIPYLKDEAAIESEIRAAHEEALAELARPVDYRPDKPEEF